MLCSFDNLCAVCVSLFKTVSCEWEFYFLFFPSHVTAAASRHVGMCIVEMVVALHYSTSTCMVGDRLARPETVVQPRLAAIPPAIAQCMQELVAAGPSDAALQWTTNAQKRQQDVVQQQLEQLDGGMHTANLPAFLECCFKLQPKVSGLLVFPFGTDLSFHRPWSQPSSLGRVCMTFSTVEWASMRTTMPLSCFSCSIALGSLPWYCFSSTCTPCCVEI
jgi:hypothetical protein